MRHARRIGLFLLALALLLPLLAWLWGAVQPLYSALVVRAADGLLALEEMGERVSRLEMAGDSILLRSGLREDGRPAEAFQAGVLHFYLVPSLAVALAFPGLAWRRRLAAAAVVTALLFTFHTAALLAAVEQTYAGVMAEVAARNYTAREAAVYRWINDSALYFAIQAVPAAVLVGLAALTGLGGPRTESEGGAAEAGTAQDPRRRGRGEPPRGRARLAFLGAAAVAAGLLVWAGARHMEKVHWRQSEQICARGYDLLEERRAAEAEPLFRRSIRLKPSFAHAHAGLGHALLMTRRHGEAAAAFTEAIRRDGGEPTWHLALSGALMGAGRRDEAVGSATAAVKRWPGDARLRIRLARLLAATGRLCGAVPHLEAYLERVPSGGQSEFARRALGDAAARCPEVEGATPARP